MYNIRGLVKTKYLARKHVYWNIDLDIEELIQNCEECRRLSDPYKGPVNQPLEEGTY